VVLSGARIGEGEGVGQRETPGDAEGVEALGGSVREERWSVPKERLKKSWIWRT